MSIIACERPPAPTVVHEVRMHPYSFFSNACQTRNADPHLRQPSSVGAMESTCLHVSPAFDLLVVDLFYVLVSIPVDHISRLSLCHADVYQSSCERPFRIECIFRCHAAQATVFGHRAIAFRSHIL